MDPHCLDIVHCLYLQDHGRGRSSWSILIVIARGNRANPVLLARMVTLGGMEFLQDGSSRIRFSLSWRPSESCRRVFLKFVSYQMESASPPRVADFRTRNRPDDPGDLGFGVSYELRQMGWKMRKVVRISAVAQGLTKLAELQGEDRFPISFPSLRSRHDPLLGLCSGRA